MRYKKVLCTFLGVTVIGAVTWTTSCNYYKRRVSVLFPGEPKSFEVLYDKEFGIPVTQIMPVLGEGVCTPILIAPLLQKIGLEKTAIKKSEKAFQSLIDRYPNSFLGYAGLAWLYKSSNPEKAEEYYSKSLKVAEENPLWTEKLDFLLPGDKKTFMHPEKVEYESEFIKVTDNVWCVCAPFKLKPDREPLLIQSTIVRLADEESLIIINPTHFTDEMQEKINELGTVRALITPTSPHGAALARCHNDIRPDAKIYGTDIFMKHEQPQLPWTGFFTSQGLVSLQNKPIKELPDGFEDEFESIFLSGHAFKEAAFYHKPSKSLLGLTDMIVYTGLSKDDFIRGPWLFRAYFFALGLHRPDLPAPVATQNYHILFCTDQARLQSSIFELKDRHIEHLVFGHGGIIHGKEDCDNALNVGFRWVTNHEQSSLQALTTKFLWTRAYHLPF